MILNCQGTCFSCPHCALFPFLVLYWHFWLVAQSTSAVLQWLYKAATELYLETKPAPLCTIKLDAHCQSVHTPTKQLKCSLTQCCSSAESFWNQLSTSYTSWWHLLDIFHGHVKRMTALPLRKLDLTGSWWNLLSCLLGCGATVVRFCQKRVTPKFLFVVL